EVLKVTVQLVVPAVLELGDGRGRRGGDAIEETLARDLRRQPHGAVHGAVLRHEAGELLGQLWVVEAAAAAAALGRPGNLEAVDAVDDVTREARLRELAVARDVDAGLGLLANDI